MRLLVLLLLLPTWGMAASNKEKMAEAYGTLFSVTQKEDLDKAWRAAIKMSKAAKGARLYTTVPKMPKAYKKDAQARHNDVYLNQLIAANKSLQEALDSPDKEQIAQT